MDEKRFERLNKRLQDILLEGSEEGLSLYFGSPDDGKSIVLSFVDPSKVKQEEVPVEQPIEEKKE